MNYKSCLYRMYECCTSAYHSCEYYGRIFDGAKDNNGLLLMLEYSNLDINQKELMGYTLLINASKTGHKSVVRLLLVTGADINLKDDDRVTALTHALQHGKENVVMLLVAAGAIITL
jgi:ankyrin repeat protein